MVDDPERSDVPNSRTDLASLVSAVVILILAALGFGVLLVWLAHIVPGVC